MASDQCRQRKVCYYYDSDIGNQYYGENHPMKPHRIRLTHNLMMNYGLHKKMLIYRPYRASEEDMTKFHTDDYIKFLKKVSPVGNNKEATKEMQKFNVVEDCPAFDGIYDFCQISAGGSIACADKINKKSVDVAINWAGGLHHAKKAEASGFCYVNDIVLGILELLKYHQRVLYIDIDIHHGDGVEEAFYTTDRVMTVSFHKYGEYFPGTGDISDRGHSKGRNYSVNFPLHDGIDDISYESIFKPVMSKVMEHYRPSVIVLQCGADSLALDRLGVFNLTLKGHGKCVEFMLKYNIPVMLLGGGGYTIRNVARCWTYETAIACNTELDNNIPFNDYYEYYEPDHKLHIGKTNATNMNTKKHLQTITNQLMSNLHELPHAPSVQMFDAPAKVELENIDPKLKADPEKRISIMDSDRRVQRLDEYSDSEDEGEGERRNKMNYRYIK